MGVIYKLNSEIKEFIITKKKQEPALSCRALSTFVIEKYKIKLSKSSINAVIKSAGLSMPVGRRSSKKPEAPAAEPTPPAERKLLAAPAQEPFPVEKTPEIQKIDTPVKEESTGAILLKAMDSLIGGSRYISETLRKGLGKEESDLLARTEALIYLSLFDLSQHKGIKTVATLCTLIGKEVFIEDIFSYLDLWQSVRIKNTELFAGILGLSQQVRGIKVLLADNKTVYLDSQFHTVWPTPYIPFDFSSTLYNTKGYINKYFFQEQPFTLFIAPGEDLPLAEFFSLISALNAQGNTIERLVLYGNKLEELQTVSLGQFRRHLFCCGLLPGQFREHRSIKKTAEFSRFYFEPLKKELYLAETEIDLSQPHINQVVTLKACILKTSPSDQPCFIIAGNNFNESGSAELLVNTYLNHWPNLQEAYRDFNRKVEFFSCIGDSQGFSPTEKLNLSALDTPQAKPLFSAYLELLHLYFRQFFLPEEFKNRDFPAIKRTFYDLKTALTREKNRVYVTFQAPPEFSSQKALEYACRRLNERELELYGRKIWFLFGRD